MQMLKNKMSESGAPAGQSYLPHHHHQSQQRNVFEGRNFPKRGNKLATVMIGRSNKPSFRMNLPPHPPSSSNPQQDNGGGGVRSEKSFKKKKGNASHLLGLYFQQRESVAPHVYSQSKTFKPRATTSHHIITKSSYLQSK